MDVLSFTYASRNLKSVMDRVVNNCEPLVIARQNAESVVLVSLSDWNAIEETSYLLSSGANAARLSEAIDQLNAGANAKRDFAEG